MYWFQENDDQLSQESRYKQSPLPPPTEGAVTQLYHIVGVLKYIVAMRWKTMSERLPFLQVDNWFICFNCSCNNCSPSSNRPLSQQSITVTHHLLTYIFAFYLNFQTKNNKLDTITTTNVYRCRHLVCQQKHLCKQHNS